MNPQLHVIGERLERLSFEPAHAGAGMKRVVAPVLRVLKWKPELVTTELAALVSLLDPTSPSRPALEERLESATKELAENTSTLEQACAIDGHPPPALLAWLCRTWKVLARVEDTITRGLEIRPIDGALLAPPLVEKGGDGNAVASTASKARDASSTVDALLAAARAEQATLGRRRRLLEAARRALLESAAASALDPAAVDERQAYIAAEITLIDRLQAAGLSPRVSLVHQARLATSRGDVQRAHAALVAMDGAASRSGDAELARLTGRALRTLWKDATPFASDARAESLARSGAETLSDAVREGVANGLAAGRSKYAQAAQSDDPNVRVVAENKLRRLDAKVEDALILAALHVDGCFDVGGVLCPARAVEEHTRTRQVTFPTQDQALLSARTIDDLPDSVTDDPRRMLHDFVSGRLLTRRYMVEETVREERTVMRGEVRAYLLDGSGSMLGPRAQMRDAILLAELSTLLSRYGDRERRVRPVLHFRYFDNTPGPLTRVGDANEALAAIESVVSTIHDGGTDIQRALLTTFDDIRTARDADASLSRAQIVLITDGAAPVDRTAVFEARAKLGTLPIGVSIIALGEENATLRELAAVERSHGESVFYHFISDGALADMASGKRDRVCIHLPDRLGPADLKSEIGGIVEEIDALQRLRENPREADAAFLEPAYDAVGLSADDRARSATEARIALARRDEETLRRIFERWFPPGSRSELASNELVPPSDDAACLDTARAVLSATADVVDLVGSTAVERRIDAVDIVERLLFESGIPSAHYADLLRRYPRALAAEIARVRRAVEDGTERRGSNGRAST